LRKFRKKDLSAIDDRLETDARLPLGHHVSDELRSQEGVEPRKNRPEGPRADQRKLLPPKKLHLGIVDPREEILAERLFDEEAAKIEERRRVL
jgi:hypothetical protein